jgi:hypothetical protein
MTVEDPAIRSTGVWDAAVGMVDEAAGRCAMLDHYGQAEAVQAARQSTLDRVFHLNPERFVRKAPEPPAKPTAV